ncbi:type II toxin-antitoxin system RelE/ParE family toxin [Neorhizobium petrolearium]|uniref:type II toxin-antitoxin system RelE/ParE family toxin n=1 Tax=Neorhizobium petrolearium TaxID=515361 RepID=UPI001F32B0BD|nr:type II toxin-antitoxin system RelE/ParE family toxin [Neorhizobium petrolearium]
MSRSWRISAFNWRKCRSPFPESFLKLAVISRRPHGQYLIFYEVLGNEISILRILHGAQDYRSILFPED